MILPAVTEAESPFWSPADSKKPSVRTEIDFSPSDLINSIRKI